MNTNQQKLTASQLIVKQLLNPAAYPHQSQNIRLLQTHCSWILLTGEFVYKIKKPVDFGFLNFSSLSNRKHHCELEHQLNCRFSPDLYLGVVPVTKSNNRIRIGEEGEVIEYAVKMHQFQSGRLLSDLQKNKELSKQHIDQLVKIVSDFHETTKQAPRESKFGEVDVISHWVMENFEHISDAKTSLEQQVRINQIKKWIEAKKDALAPVFRQRKLSGFIRSCHGDLHLKNITLIGEQVKLFDCIEFNEELQWIDVMSDVAFLLMDLEEKGATKLAHRFLNGYLERTGDYFGLRVLTFYKVYRGLVRVKVAMLADQQQDKLSQRSKEQDQYLDYISHLITEPKPQLVICFGFSGSGKTHLVKQLCNEIGYIYVRSDVERKRLSGLRPLDKSHSQLDGGLYTTAQTEQTYRRIFDLAGEVIESGFGVILDATFLQKRFRNWASDLAADKGVKLKVLHCFAPDKLLKERIMSRQQDEEDASEADLKVLALQQDNCEMLTDDELNLTVKADTTDSNLLPALARKILEP